MKAVNECKPSIRTTLDVLRMIGPAVPLYAGEASLEALEGFVSGFAVACRFFDVPFAEDEPDLAKFSAWLRQRYKRPSTAKGWRRIIVDEVGEDGKRAIEQFYQLITEFLESGSDGTPSDARPRADECESEMRRNQVNKSTRNTGKAWTREDLSQLKTLARDNTPTRVIGLKLGRTEDAVRSKASQEGVSLGPWNQTPYSRQKK